MEIQTIGSRQLAVYIGVEELADRGILPGMAGFRELLGLVRDACGEAGLEPGTLAEIEAAPEGEGLLILIRLEGQEPEWFAFDTLTDALEALTALTVPPSGALGKKGEQWLLQAASEGEGAVLSEFASPAAGPPADTLAEGDALAALWWVLRREKL